MLSCVYPPQADNGLRKYMKHSFYKLVLVTQKQQKPPDEYLRFISICVQNGVSAVQLREKKLSKSNTYTFASQLKDCLSALNTPLIINDDLDLALTIDADGLHLGQDDGDIFQARHCLGPNKILGLSVNTFAQLAQANAYPIDYIGVGAIFPTNSKTEVQTIWGCQALKQAVAISSHRVIAIGGINTNNIDAVLDTGAHGIAAIEAFHHTTAPGPATQLLSDSITNRGHPC